MPITPPTIAIITSKMHIFLRADFCERKKNSEVQYLHMLLKQLPQYFQILFDSLPLLIRNIDKFNSS